MPKVKLVLFDCEKILICKICRLLNSQIILKGTWFDSKSDILVPVWYVRVWSDRMTCHGLCLPSDMNFIAGLTAPERRQAYVFKSLTHWGLILLKHFVEESICASAQWISVSNLFSCKKWYFTADSLCLGLITVIRLSIGHALLSWGAKLIVFFKEPGVESELRWAPNGKMFSITVQIHDQNFLFYSTVR